jgi:hypothetical protein
MIRLDYLSLSIALTAVALLSSTLLSRPAVARDAASGVFRLEEATVADINAAFLEQR